MKDTVTREAYAKINLGLDVTGVREDGYHLVRMIMQTIGLHDTLRFRISGETHREEEPAAPVEETVEKTVKRTYADSSGRASAARITIRSSDPEMPAGEDNLITKAIRRMYTEFGISADLEVTVDKRIPAAAGLAGGSSDAAAAFTAVRELFDLDVSDEELQNLALPLGADIPYCFHGGTQLAEGIGEVLTPLPDAPPCSVVLVKPETPVPTGAVYRALDALSHYEHPEIDAQAEAIRRGNLAETAGLCGNVLELVTGKNVPVIGDIEQFFTRHGALTAKMSGSGPSVFALYTRKETAEEAMNLFLQDTMSEGCRCFLTDFADRDRIRTGVTHNL